MSSKHDGGSFRDPAGFVFYQKGKVYRQINHVAQQDYDLLMKSGLYKTLVDKGLLVSHSEVKSLAGLPEDSRRYKLIKPDAIPFISYPYEWTFDQLKAAAQATLQLQTIALDHGMSLKDASAYNIQFVGTRPICIDTLSFTAYQPGDHWEGYKQFCEHFIAPLAVAHYTSQDIIKSLRVNLDGIPLKMACQLLPRRARMKSGLFAHVYLHANAQRRHQEGGKVVAEKAKQRKMSPIAMRGLVSNLERTVHRLKSTTEDTQWGDYYTFTNYSDEAFATKRKIVAALLKKLPIKPTIVWDVGANNGEFTEVAAEQGAYTVAFDIDTMAVSRNYHMRKKSDLRERMLPLVQDLTNPSPSLGWAHNERMSLEHRGPADALLALAIIHHLAIGNNLPFDRIAEYFSKITKYLIIEFVPKGDSKVDHLLASRKDIFDEYDKGHFEAAFNRHFSLVESQPVKGSKRSVYLYKSHL